MTEPIDVAIQAAILTYLQAAALGSVSYPLVPFTPVPGTPYYDAHAILRADTQDLSISFVGSVIRRGIFQVDAVVPDGAGEAPGLRMAALVAAVFVQGLSLVASGYKLQFQTVPKIATAVKDAPWVRFPVSIPFMLIS